MSEGYVTDCEEKLVKAVDMLANHNGPGGDFTGWVCLSRDYDKKSLLGSRLLPGRSGSRETSIFVSRPLTRPLNGIGNGN